jgi:hypothetical protein
MGGGLMQLVAYGAQDIYLTGNPQITFFKVVYRRHTNFSMESIQQTWNGSNGFDQTATATISRNGDLVNRMYVEFNAGVLKDVTTTAEQAALGPNVGNTLLKEIECEIGGQRIDRHYNHWLTTWNDLTESNPTASSGAVDEVGEPSSGATKYQKMSYNHKGTDTLSATTANDPPTVAFVPLQFWFCRNPGLALPLIALQYHEVKIKITFCKKTDIFIAATSEFNLDPQLWVDYIYLDTDERRRFAQVSHEYLIEQLQFSEGLVTAGVDGNYQMNFNHPVKELIFTGQPAALTKTDADKKGPAVPQVMQAADAANDLVIGLKLNGHERFAPRNIEYFTRTQVYQHHTGNGGVINRDSIGVYSFALKPEEHQPSGTCNFSRIDNAQLTVHGTVDGATPAINVYAVNYNVLRIMSGMGGLAYSN